MSRIWQPLRHCRILLVLLIWILAGTLAWFDLLDLQDDLVRPVAERQQVMEAESDELRGTAVLAITIVDSLIETPLPSQAAPAFARAAAWEDAQAHARLRHARLSVYRL
ncbi:MAG: hypothetical protein KF814_10795 [Nitrospiraceae bacterium]|nr:hypothetical protein [Nitrospiraceae bacterium]